MVGHARLDMKHTLPLCAVLCASVIAASGGEEALDGPDRAHDTGIRVLWPAEGAVIAPGIAVPFVFRVLGQQDARLEVTVDGLSYASGHTSSEGGSQIIRTLALPAHEEEGTHVVEVMASCEDGKWEAKTRAVWHVDWGRGTTQWSQGLIDLKRGNAIWNVADWCCIPPLQVNEDIDTAVCCTSSLGRMFALAADSRGHDVRMLHHSPTQDLALLHKPTFHASMSILVEKIVTQILEMGLVLPYPAAEVSLMAAAMVHARPDFVFEWGTNSGCSARVFFESSELLGLKTVIHSTDLSEDMMSKETFQQIREGRGEKVRGRRFRETVHLHVGDGLNESMRVWEDEGWAAARVLWYIDGDHSEKAVRRELDAIASHSSCAREVGDMPVEGVWTWPGDGCYILMHDTHPAISRTGAHSAAEAWWQGTNAERFGKSEVSLGSPGMTLFWPRNL